MFFALRVRASKSASVIFLAAAEHAICSSGTRLFRAYDINQINADPVLGSFNSMKQNLDRAAGRTGRVVRRA